MKAIVITGYGDRDKLLLRELERPVPTADQVLVRVIASSLNPLDWKLRRGMLRLIWPLKFPFIPGFDVAGIIEAVGESVETWKVGDGVMVGLSNGGGHAEFVAADQSLCATKPSSLSDHACAAAPSAAVSALQALRDLAGVQPAQRVLINGASGGVGTFAVQIAKVLQCHVTAVCSTANVDLVRSLGADEVIDYTRQEVLKSGRYDVFFDVVPNQKFSKCLSTLTNDGIYLTTLPGPGALLWKLIVSAGRPFGFRKRCAMLVVKPNGVDLQFISELLAKGELRSEVETVYPLEEMREAHARSEGGHSRGKIVIQVGNGGNESDADG